jgi:hypothetical protein
LHAATVYQTLVTGEPLDQGGIFDLVKVEDWKRWQWEHNYDPRDIIDEETGIKTGYHVPAEVKAALERESDVISVHQTYKARTASVARAEQALEKAMQDVSEASSRRGFRRAKAPENHPQDCICTECLRSDPLKADNYIRIAKEQLEEARERAKEYSPDSAREQQAQAAYSAAGTALADCFDRKSLAALRTSYRRELKAEADRRKHHENIRKNIADLPQLFIAV